MTQRNSGRALLSAVLAGALCVAIASSASRVAAQALGPGSERAVSALVIAGGPLRDGTHITAVRVEARTIVVSLRERSGAAREVSLVPRGAGGVATLATAPSFDLIGAPEATAVASVLAARLRVRDNGHFWSAAASAPSAGGRSSSATELGWADDVRRVLGWAALVALLSVLGVRAVRNARNSRRRRRVLLPIVAAAVAVFALALVLRVAVTPWAPLHSNEHGVATVRGLVAPHAIGPDESTRYGVAYARLVRPIAALAGGDWRAPFAVAAVAGALTALLVLLLAHGLTRSLSAAVVAGVGVALHPMHVRVSGSETSLVLAAALATLALLGVHVALDLTRARRSRVVAIWIVGLATAASLELSWTAPSFAAGVALFAMALWRPGALRDLRAHITGTVLWVALAAGLHALSLSGLDSGASRWPFAHGEFPAGDALGGERSGLHDATMASPALVPLAVLGAVALVWKRRWRGVLGLLLFGAVALIAAALVSAARRDVIRYAAGAHLIHFVLASGLVLVARRRTKRVAIAGALTALLIGTSIVGLDDVARPDATAIEWAVARQAPPGLHAVVVAPYRLSDKVLSDYPEYLAPGPPRAVVTRTADARGCRIWVGMPCWSFSREEFAADGGVDVGIGPMRRECVEMLGGVSAARAALPALRPVDVRHRLGELHLVPASVPRIGYAPCAGP